MSVLFLKFYVVNIVAGAVFRGRCQSVGRCVSFEGLRFTWQAHGIRTMDPIRSNGWIPEKVAFLELQLDTAIVWPAQHFV